MRRVLLLLITVLGLLQVTGAVPLEPTQTSEQAPLSESDDCCPDGSDEAGHCCDWDLGACCAASVVAALPSGTPTTEPERVGPQPELRPALSLHLLLPRDNGPPPTPPPIG